MLASRVRVISLARQWRGPQGVRPVAGPALKAIEVERLLAWAYREELPKAAPPPPPAGVANAWAPVGRWLDELSEKVAEPNAYGVVPMRGPDLRPHPDALLVHEAVAGLDDLDLSIPDDWQPFADFGDLGEAGRMAARGALAYMADACRLRRLPRQLIVRHALLGGCPDWESEQPVLEIVRAGNGAPRWYIKRAILMATVSGGEVSTEVEVDGWCPRKRRPLTGAYQKSVLRPDPAPAAIGRAEYEVWHAALGVIAADLEGVLSGHDVRACARPARPWEADAVAGPAPRVLRDVRVAK